MKTVRYILFLAFLSCSIPAFAQVEGLVSPGELSRAHEKFSGVKNCNVCHAANKNVLESKCLDCHKELAARIAQKKGFHADKATGCMSCHSEHLGRNYDVRGLDMSKFRHEETGYPLQGRHALVKDCAACHKTRSFLLASTTCISCHKDPHRGNLPNCEGCHAVQRPMKQVVYDHSVTKYPLTGAHSTVTCEKCHREQVYKLVNFTNCSSCHTDPHKATLGNDCTRCHTTEKWKAVDVRHIAFPLTGKHATVACSGCHPNNQWKVTAFSKCSDCHKDPHLWQFAGQACETCHNVNGFKPARFDHAKFPLEEKHNIECVKCHKLERGKFPSGTGQAVRFVPVRTDCVSCHQDVHGGQLGNKCEKCHTVSTFKMQAFDHSKTRYPLDMVHSKVACEKCHTKDPKTALIRYTGLATTCTPCHTDPHKGQLDSKCEKCHAPTGLKFDHATFASYKLAGMHSKVECAKCHRTETGNFPAGPGTAVRYKPLATNCSSCHADYHRGQFTTDCAECHTTASFKATTFTHAKSRFPLSGAHEKLECAKCHKLERFETPAPAAELVRYRPVSRACTPCHTDPHKAAFGDNCTKCHNDQKWKDVSLSFHKTGKFPLEGRHQTVKCQACHINNVIYGTPTRCYDCHWIRRQDDLYRTKLGNTCEDCHQPRSWTETTWEHGDMTNVALNAQHSTLSCENCHVQQTFQAGEVQCFSCHSQQYYSTTSPNHQQAGYSTQCQGCHNPGDASWTTSAVDHNAFFPLVGVHATLACSNCHINNQFKGTPTTCIGCHQAQYNATTNPNHQQAGFSTTCDSCHKATDSNWTSASFNHNSFYPLVGVHATQQCAACHANGQYANAPTTCFGCHQAQYNATTSPNHKAAGFPTTCENCHQASAANWKGAFNHNSVFPLVGVHATLQCTQCHVNNVFKGTPKICSGCHMAQYNATTNPNHKTAHFPTTCDSCHKATDPSWLGAKFDHNKFYPLVGVHASTACAACHPNGRYTGTPTTCVGCHLTQYNATTNPNHKQANFPTTCDACHKASAPSWLGATFNHNSFFPLLGVHATIQCAACHTGGRYAGIPTTCVGCHLAQYNSTNNPNHAAAGFPTTCDSCHKATDTSWLQGVFDHTWFPISSGRHAGFPCSACHTNPGAYVVFQCLSCHPCSQVTPQHGDVGGFVCDSPHCYHCHPNGTAGD